MSEAAATRYPVAVSAEAPDRYDRIQILLRIGVYWIVSVLPMGFALLLIPVVSAVLISQQGGKDFLETNGALYGRALGFVLGVYAWMYYATDQFPRWDQEGAFRARVHPSGEPTVGSALWRYVTVVPHAIAVWLLFVPAVILGLMAVMAVLFSERVPSFILRYELAFVAYTGRSLAYYASIVDEYPPFTLSTNP